MSDPLDNPRLSSAYFFPRRAPFADPFFVDAAPGVRLACHRTVGEAGAPTVVYFHGNGEVVADMLPAFPAWVSGSGASVLLAEYRGYGMSTGQPGLVAMLEDVGAIVRAAGVDPSRAVFFGRSVGSIFAIEAVRRYPEAAGLVLESGIFDVSERVRLRVSAADLGVDESTFAAALARFDPRAALAAFRGRTLVLHTRHDEIVSVSHAERLFAAAREPKRLELFDRGGHNTIYFENHAAYRAAVLALVASVR